MQSPTSDLTTTSPSLLVSAKGQDDLAWQRLVFLYEPLIQEWCRKSQVSANDAADIAQDVLAAVWNSLGEFRKSNPGDSFRGWLRTITRNKICDHFRRTSLQAAAIGGSTAQARFQEVPELSADEDDDDSTEALQEEHQLIWKALDLIRAEFEPKTWAAFWMTVVDGQTVIDAAKELGVSPGAVRQSKYKLLRRLRNEIGDWIPDSRSGVQNV